MAKIRDDIVGVVRAGEYVLRPGDTVPDGVTVGEHVLAPEPKPAPEEKPRRSRRKADAEEE